MATCYQPVRVRVAAETVCKDCDDYCILVKQLPYLDGVPQYDYKCSDMEDCCRLLCRMTGADALPPAHKTTMVEIADPEICSGCVYFYLQPETLFDDGDQPRQHYACQHLDECQRKIAHFREAGIK